MMHTAVFQKAPVMLNQHEKIKPIALAIIELHLSEGIKQLVSQSVSQSVSRLLLFKIL